MGYQEDFINQIAPHVTAWRNYLGFGVASAIIAQACLESAYGRSNKAHNYNNYFGLKYKDGRVDCNDGYFTDTSSEQLPDGTYITITTKWFSFPDMHEGVHGYFEFVDYPRYAAIKDAKTPEIYLSILKDAGYATSQNYVTNCMRIVTQYNLTQYDEGGLHMLPESSLAIALINSPNTYGFRGKPSKITIHHMGCYPSPGAVDQCQRFANPNRKASATYSIGNDGTICQGLLESYAPQTSSSRSNDMKAITIEVANASGAPDWTISAAAMTSLINLLADICKRNAIRSLIWSPNKTDRVNGVNGVNMTLHKDFSSTACPGPFLTACMPLIALATDQLLASGPSGYILNGYDYAPVFDPEFYANTYPDLKAVYGNNAQGLWEHFKQFGMNEARQGAAEFDPKYYRAHYSDINAVYGSDWPSYYLHYVMFGKDEGRKGAP